MIESVLSQIEGGSVLDIATQEGHFIQILMRYLKSYSEIIGIDINEEAIASARSISGGPNIKFLVMNAEKLDFEDERFDTVTISASLHHLPDIPQVLDEMVRVLKPGGRFILVEMHQDGQTPAAKTSVYLHQWVAEVDSALGILHNKTLGCQEFKGYVSDLGLSDITYYFEDDSNSNPKEITRIKQLDALIDRTLLRVDRADNSSILKERGRELRLRLHQIGAQREPTILIYGVK